MRISFWQVYFLLVVIDILVGSFDFDPYRMVSKPLILLSLLVYFQRNGKHLGKPTYLLMLLALVLSLMGDLFLLFDAGSSTNFMLGLGAFLLAHLTYGAVFLKKRNKRPPLYLFGALMILVAVGVLLFFYVRDGLGDLTSPVLVYILGILFMAAASVFRLRKVPIASFLWVFIGAMLFVASDSILAIDMFKFDVPWSHLWIMGSYAAAQYLIVKGVLKQNRDYKI